MSHSTTAFPEGKCRRLKILCIFETGGQAVLTYTLQCGLHGKCPNDTLDDYLKKLPRNSTSRFMELVEKKMESEKKKLESEKKKLESQKKKLELEKNELESEKNKLESEKSKLESEEKRQESEKKKLELEKKKIELEKKIMELEKKLMQSWSPDIHEVSQKIIKDQFDKTNMDQINKDPSCTKFDVTLLHKAIKLACEGVDKDESKWKTKTTPPTLEYLVTRIKEERNTIVHEDVPLDQHEYDEKVKNLKALFTDTLQATKVRYNRDQNEVTAKDKEVMGNIGSIITEPLSLNDIKQRFPSHLLCLFKQEAVLEIKQRLEGAQSLSPLEFLSGKEDLRLEVACIFSRITIKDEKQSSESAEKTVSHNELMLLTQRRGSPPSPQLLLVEGDAGSGKTTLLTFILAEWLKDEPQRQMKGLQDFDLIFWVVCREQTSKTLQSLVEKALPRSFLIFKMSLISLVKGCKVLFLIDGLDELTEESRSLLKDILSEVENCPWITILCSSRPEGVKGMKARTPKQFQLTHTKIVGIPAEERTGFVEKYVLCLSTAKSVNTGNLRQKTQKVINKDIFRLPLNLVFLAQIFSKDHHKISDEVTETELYTTIVEWCTEKLQHRLLATQEILHLEDKIENVLEVMYRVAFDQTLRYELFITKNNKKAISSSCKEEGLPEGEVLSSLLSLRCGHYSFPHKSLQEFFAAQHVIGCIDVYEVGAIRCLLRDPTPKNLSSLRNLLFHILGLLCRQRSKTINAMEETVDLLHESGVEETENWLAVLADKEVDQHSLKRVAHHIKEGNDRVSILDATVKVAALLLPLIPRKTITIYVEMDPEEKDVQRIIKAVTHHDLEQVYLWHHCKHPDPAHPSAHLLQQISKSHLERFAGYLDEEHFSLLPGCLKELRLSVAGNDHLQRLISSLQNIRENFPHFRGLILHVPVSRVTLHSPLPLPDGIMLVYLVLSGVGDGDIDAALQTIQYLCPRDGTEYADLVFPGSSLGFAGYSQLLHGLATRSVSIGGVIKVLDTTITADEEKQLCTLSRSLLGRWFVRCCEVSLWQWGIV